MTNEAPDIAALANRAVQAVDAYLDKLGEYVADFPEISYEINEFRRLSKRITSELRISIKGNPTQGKHPRQLVTSAHLTAADLPCWRDRLPDLLAKEHQCSRDDALVFLDWLDHPENVPSIPCAYSGCTNADAQFSHFYSPRDVGMVLRRAANELWYCGAHATKAFRRDGVISDPVARALSELLPSPGRKAWELYLDPAIRRFLLTAGLAARSTRRDADLRIDGGPAGRWYITNFGEDVLRKRTKPLGPSSTAQEC